MKLALFKWTYLGQQPDEKIEETEIVAHLNESLRNLRQAMLNECDWTICLDSPLDQETKDAWIAWRKWMRDITQHITISEVIEYVEIPDPPVVGRPKSWANVEAE